MGRSTFKVITVPESPGISEDDRRVADRIFTRMGTGDNLESNSSTFMTEMKETAFIMQNVSSRSLIVIDELGRATSSSDGLAIAWSCWKCASQKFGSQRAIDTWFGYLLQAVLSLLGCSCATIKWIPSHGQRLCICGLCCGYRWELETAAPVVYYTRTTMRDAQQMVPASNVEARDRVLELDEDRSYVVDRAQVMANRKEYFEV
ncbi:hypothetical protein IFM89_007004 [Coptis chinensis]|uniref:DNA mismatch repair proteins mutS family domain-containing protein n=1 Tax=Coptis chinensis TaxID=261450 RepID=A0A835ILJ9_9MAGN|nr:hypothetical protein IFM89_007004 [Coptis chinensis]